MKGLALLLLALVAGAALSGARPGEGGCAVAASGAVRQRRRRQRCHRLVGLAWTCVPNPAALITRSSSTLNTCATLRASCNSPLCV